MIRINLLDWRDAIREERRRKFLGTLVFTALVCAGIIALVSVFIYGQRIEAQRQRNDYLERQINIAERKMAELKKVKAERASLLRRMRIIEELQRSRAYIVHYFDQIAGTLPEGVYLTSLNQHGDSTTLNGVAESNARVSEYMVNLDNSPYLDNPRLIVIESSGGAERNARFTLRVSSQPPDNTSGGANQQLADTSR